ncbi:MAG: AI-2E family transporter [Chitinophagales bacterium]|nr:AI-2E family transporter [Chitinophagales bacterium]
MDVLNNENVQKITGQVVPIAQKTLGGTFTALGNVFLMYLVLYFMMTEAQKLRAWIRKNLPLKLTNAKKVTQEINSLVFSNTIGIPMVAIIQGVVGVIGYWLFGVEEFILMGMLTAIASVIPLVGTMIIYLPLAVYQFAMGDTFNGIGILLWGFIVIGSVDNIARFLIQKKLADVHPLVTLLGVIIGVNMFGFIGIIFGPLLLSIFFILVRVYVDEFGRTTNLPTDEVAKG